MKWFDSWFAKKCKQAWNDTPHQSSQYSSAVEGGLSLGQIGALKPRRLGVQKSQLDSSPQLAVRPMNFRMYDASGGWVLEYNYYDEEKDENINSLHIITADADLGTEIGRIITFEILRK